MASPAPKGERQLVRRLGGLCPGTPELPFGDDLAALAGDLLWSCDMLMDGVDFDSRSHPWRLIGRKAMAVNLSDCAAMGARPAGALCAVALADALSAEAAYELMAGVAECGAEFGCPLRGGDTNSWPQPTVISVTIAAHAGPGLLRRDQARPGDTVWLSGPVGGSLLGRHLTFSPRVDLGLRIAAELPAGAAIDVSDGLAIDLARVCEASGVGASIDAVALEPLIHPDAHIRSRTTGRTPREHALGDGEDFELLVTLRPNAPTERCEALGLRCIGRITADRELRLVEADGASHPLPILGWEHFR
jgi:thiamine-monophosphate kinase